MPKSRHRKDHKKKVAARNNRLRAKRNAFNKRLQEMFANRVTESDGENNEEINTEEQ
jgi:hypothetical protein